MDAIAIFAPKTNSPNHLEIFKYTIEEEIFERMVMGAIIRTNRKIINKKNLGHREYTKRGKDEFGLVETILVT